MYVDNHHHRCNKERSYEVATVETVGECPHTAVMSTRKSPTSDDRQVVQYTPGFRGSRVSLNYCRLHREEIGVERIGSARGKHVVLLTYVQGTCSHYSHRGTLPLKDRGSLYRATFHYHTHFQEIWQNLRIDWLINKTPERLSVHHSPQKKVEYKFKVM